MGTKRTYVLGGEPVTVVALPNPTEERAWQFREFVESDPLSILGLDVETSGIEDDKDAASPIFDPSAKLRLVQFGTEHEAWVLDPHEPMWRDEIENALHGYDISHNELDETLSQRFVSHTNYDPLWLQREFGVNLGREDRSLDTMPMMCLLEPGPREPHNLKSWTTRLIGPELANAEEELIAEFRRLAPTGQRVGKTLKNWGFSHIPLNNPIYTKYGGLDAIAVRRLLGKLSALMRSPKEKRLSRREQTVQRIANDMQWRGLRVDMERTRDVLGQIEGEYKEADTWLADTMGCSPRSPKRLDWLTGRGVEFVVKTPTGRGKLDKDTIPVLAAKYDGTEAGEALRHMETLSTHQNFLNNLRIIVRNAGRDGVVHPQINTQRATTGRMSIVKPAMQTFKKTDKRLRGCFIARDGMTLVGADYDSQEIRIAAAYSQDPLYLEIVATGVKQHVVTAKKIFGDDYTEDDYKFAKILNFLQQYGGGPRAIVAQLKGVSLAEAKKLWLAWRETYSGLIEWNEFMAELAVVVNPWGRRIPRDRWRPYANGNYMIQSSGRDLLGDALVKIREEHGHGAWLWLPIHDELILEVPEDAETIEYAKGMLETAMRANLQGIELTATAEHIGHRWGGEDKPS